MDDRNVQYPNRFQLTKVDGTDDIYEIIPAPGEVYTEGTFINKFALLKDTTAALFGLDVSNVPDDVLAFLGKYNQYWWKARPLENTKVPQIGDDLLEVTLASATYDHYEEQAPNTTYSVSASSKIEIKNNSVVLVSPVTTVSFTLYDQPDGSTIRGKYIKPSGSSQIYFVSDNSGFHEKTETFVSGTLDRASVYINAYKVIVKTMESPGEWECIWSVDRNAYPDSGIQDGYEYQFLGIPFENSVLPLRVETGSYVGTGTYGVNNPCSLTLPFEPKLFIVGDTDGRKGTKGNYLYFALPIFLGDTYEKIDWKFGGTTATQYTLMKREGSTISWYINFTGSGSDQLNGTGTTYYYYAIG